MYYIGFDIGGTKIEAMLICVGQKSENKNDVLSFEVLKENDEIILSSVLDRKRVPTERHLGYSQIIEKMSSLAKELCQKNQIEETKIQGVGLSVPGPVDPMSGVVLRSNTMVISGHNMNKDLQQKLKWDCPFRSENDANCFALAEVFCGAGLSYFKETKIPVKKQIGVGLILGSGFGGGIVVHGKVVSGKCGGGGELGHMTLYPNGHPCYCGRQGCAEQYLCGPALEALMNTRIYAQIHQRPTSKDIFEYYEKKDPIALAVVNQYRKDLSFFLGTITCALDPHYFVMGGGLSLQKVLYENLEKNIGKNTYLPNESVKVYQHCIGDSAGAIGALIPFLNRS